jgi:hypothetical protein
MNSFYVDNQYTFLKAYHFSPSASCFEHYIPLIIDSKVEMGSAKPPWYQYSNPLAAMYHIACCEDEAPLVI